MPVLNWIGKDAVVKHHKDVPYRLLEPVEELSYGEKSDNLIVHGDNLHALKALLPKFAKQVKCIYIDPPYNTGNEGWAYNDNVNSPEIRKWLGEVVGKEGETLDRHDRWLCMMYPRLMLLREFLREDGTIWISIDDNEQGHLRALCDEIFGAKNFINQISAKMKQTSGASGGGEDKKLKKNIEYILVYTKNKDSFDSFNEIYEEENLFDHIAEMKDENKSWKYTRIIQSFGDRKFYKQIQDGKGEPIDIYLHDNVVIKSIKEIMDEENISEVDFYIKYFAQIWRDTNAQSSIRTKVLNNIENNQFCSIEYVPISGKNKGQKTTLYYKGEKCDLLAWLKDVAVKKKNSIVKLEKLGTFWQGFPLNNLTKEGGVQFTNGKKPELLLQRIIELATNEGDIVLDSFLGSGTLAAVAHKLHRKWIGVEFEEHCFTHCIPRLKRVIDGDDSGGITKITNWQGGGGFTFCKLSAEPIFNPDGTIRKDISFAQLAEFVWLLETGTAYKGSADSAMLGVHEERAIYLLYNGILKDRSVKGGNVLTKSIYQDLPKFAGNKVIYATAFRGSWQKNENITFKQTPYALKG